MNKLADIFEKPDQESESSAEVIPMFECEDEHELFDSSDPLPNVLNIIPLRGNVLFPGVILPLNAERKKSIQLLRHAEKTGEIIGIVAQRNQAQEPKRCDYYNYGVTAKVLQFFEIPEGPSMAIVQGLKVFELGEISNRGKYVSGAVIRRVFENDESFKDAAAKQLLKRLSIKFEETMKAKRMPASVIKMFKHLKTPRLMVNMYISHIDCPHEIKQGLLEKFNYLDRALELEAILEEALQIAKVKDDLENRTKKVLAGQQREFFLRQEMAEIQNELGDNPVNQDIDNLYLRAQKKKWNAELEQFFFSEVEKLKRIPPQVPDYVVQYNYLSLLLDLPWNEYTKDKVDITRARKVLDHDHYGLEKVKERILEYIAVMQLKKDLKSPILCLVGPPGTGKTSLGKSIASALGRKYVRVALGGLHDESEIRGHRKTYVGSMPGRIIQSIKKAQSSNPVFILDEIDKVQTNTVNGDPTSALLEVLDPEQNKAFHDNYLDLDYDLSNVLFIATANSINSIQSALLDRMEIIDLSGYILEEKIEIASRHLVPKQLVENGFKRSSIKFSPKVLETIINDYTREAGVRQLDKSIAQIVRRKAVKVVAGEEIGKAIEKSELKDLLGMPVHQSEQCGKKDRVGVVTGLAWTSVGGEILFVESSTCKGKGELSMTGNLGDVMKESATLAYQYLKANADSFGINYNDLENTNIHIHVPEGATPKDGPSAGITMFTAMVSAFTGRPVRSNFAMTGEITLRGVVTPIGGVKEKLLAAKRAHITDIVLCDENRRDVEDIESKYLEGLNFHYINDMSEVLPLVLTK